MRNRNRKNYGNDETQSTDEVLSGEANNLIEKNYPFSGRLIDGLQASNWLIESLSKILTNIDDLKDDKKYG